MRSSSCSTAGRKLVRAGHHVTCPYCASAELRPAGDLNGGGSGGHEQAGPTGVLLAQRRDGVLRRLHGVDCHRVRSPPQGGRNAGLMAGRDLQQGGDRTHQSRHLVACGKERRGAILASQVELESIEAGAGT